MGDINSSVCKHAKSGHRIDWENKEILDKAKDRWRLLLKEIFLKVILRNIRTLEIIYSV